MLDGRIPEIIYPVSTQAKFPHAVMMRNVRTTRDGRRYADIAEAILWATDHFGPASIAWICWDTSFRFATADNAFEFKMRWG